MQEKKADEAKKKMAAAKQEVKELKMSYKIDTHDYDVRLRAAKKFLSKGDKVKVVCLLKGREVEFKSIALEMFGKFVEELKEDGTQDGRIGMEGARHDFQGAPALFYAAETQRGEAAPTQLADAAGLCVCCVHRRPVDDLDDQAHEGARMAETCARLLNDSCPA